MRLIDADALKEKAFFHEVDNVSYVEEEDIDKAPTVDAVERKKGKWIKISITDDGYAVNFRCSCCKESDVKYPWKYCPNCGAEMRGENNG